MKNAQILVALACSASALWPSAAVAESDYQAAPMPGLSGTRYAEARTWNAPPGQIDNPWHANPQPAYPEAPVYWSNPEQRSESATPDAGTQYPQAPSYDAQQEMNAYPVEQAPLINQPREYLGPTGYPSQPMAPQTYYPATAAQPGYPAPHQSGNAPAYYGGEMQPQTGYAAPVYGDAYTNTQQPNRPRTYPAPQPSVAPAYQGQYRQPDYPGYPHQASRNPGYNPPPATQPDYRNAPTYPTDYEATYPPQAPAYSAYPAARAQQSVPTQPYQTAPRYHEPPPVNPLSTYLPPLAPPSFPEMPVPHFAPPAPKEHPTAPAYPPGNYAVKQVLGPAPGDPAAYHEQTAGAPTPTVPVVTPEFTAPPVAMPEPTPVPTLAPAAAAPPEAPPAVTLPARKVIEPEPRPAAPVAEPAPATTLPTPQVIEPEPRPANPVVEPVLAPATAAEPQATDKAPQPASRRAQ